MSNIAKYATPRAWRFGWRSRTDDLTFEVTDDGAGFDPATAAHGTGLRGMADRVEAIGGSLTVTSAPGAGTTVTGQVPV